MTTDIIRVLQVIEYTGPREEMEKHFRNKFITTQRKNAQDCKDVYLQASILGNFPETIKVPLPDYVAPVPGSTWKHYKGPEYVVLFLTNFPGDRLGHPIEVIYANTENGSKYSRLLSDWHRSFTEIKDAKNVDGV